MKLDPSHPLAARATSATIRAPEQKALDLAVKPGGIIRLTLPSPPSVNTLHGVRVMMVRGQPRAVPYKTHAHADYLGAVANAVRCAALREPRLQRLHESPAFTGPVRFTWHWHRPRAVGDLDNPLKALWDSLTAARVWGDDSQVVELHGYRHDDKTNPRVDVDIEAL